MSGDGYGMDKFYDATDKLITVDIDNMRNTQLSNWQNFNVGVTSMRFSSSTESSGFPTMTPPIMGGKLVLDDNDETESISRFRAESLSS